MPFEVSISNSLHWYLTARSVACPSQYQLPGGGGGGGWSLGGYGMSVSVERSKQ